MSDLRTSPSPKISSMENNSSLILKGILAVPVSNRAVSPENFSPNAPNVSSPNQLQQSGKKSPPPSKERTPKKNSKKRSSQSSPETLSTPTSSYFASSAFMNSPDPLTIPLPNFDDDDDVIIVEPHLLLQNKTTALWQMLQVK